jgi:Ca2+-binding EF-hand superfamily protein
MLVWASMPPEAEWSANWPALAGVTGAAVPATTKSGALSLDDVDVRFAPLPRQNGNANPTSYLLRFYQMADPAGKGVDKESLKGPQLQLLAQVFGLLDRDGDGKLVEKEVRDFVDLQAEGLNCHVGLSFADQGRGLFSTLDADRDGRLSKRELRSLWTRLESRDKDGDGAIAPTEIPRQSTLTAGFGITTPFGRNPAAFNPGMQPTAPRAPAYPQGVPNWFMRMDTNGDGEVSRREFLGTTEQFREFDADGDGSISPEEVAKKK